VAVGDKAPSAAQKEEDALLQKLRSLFCLWNKCPRTDQEQTYRDHVPKVR